MLVGAEKLWKATEQAQQGSTRRKGGHWRAGEGCFSLHPNSGLFLVSCIPNPARRSDWHVGTLPARPQVLPCGSFCLDYLVSSYPCSAFKPKSKHLLQGAFPEASRPPFCIASDHELKSPLWGQAVP